MVDFEKLIKNKKERNVKDLLELFESLDRYSSHIELRPSQEQAVKILTERRMERDLVLKLSTGAGKTVVGLLYLYSYMEELEKPVVFLCPTLQLVDQVYNEANKLGISATKYLGGERYPSVEGISGKAIIICTYDKMFNAKTTFDRDDIKLRPCAIVLDDVHSGIEEIKKSFTLKIYNENILNEFIKLLNNTCSDFKPSTWQNIVDGDPREVLEIPYWLIEPVSKEIHELFHSNSGSAEFVFVWNNIREDLKFCRYFISGHAIEVVPDILPVEKIYSYHNAQHRLYMSATLADDSILVRDLACEREAAKNPIYSKNDKGLGERMVLVPSLIDVSLNKEKMIQWAAKMSKKWKVVVLSSSEEDARKWEAGGANVYIKNEIFDGIDNLKDENSGINYAVLVQRYDGVDLNDNSCRILIIDGLPIGDNLSDKLDSQIFDSIGILKNKMIYRIEQGMGRAVRSHVDYAVIILLGNDVATFIARKEIQNIMNPDTSAQLKLALELAKILKDEDKAPEQSFTELVYQCLERNTKQNIAWKQFYDDRIRKGFKKISKNVDNDRIELAENERKIFHSVSGNNFDLKTFEDFIFSNINNPKELGIYVQKLAKYFYFIDKAKGFEFQRIAYEKNNNLFRPPHIVRKVKPPEKFVTQDVISSWCSQYENPNGALALIAEIRSKLSFSVKPKTFEKAIKDLGEIIGANSFRPEDEWDEGPDNLWIWPNISLVIEVKNQNENTVHAKDAGQLFRSLEWYNKNYPALNEPVPVIIAKTKFCDSKSGFLDGTRILTEKKLELLLNNIYDFIKHIMEIPPLLRQAKFIYDSQVKFELLPENFIGNYTERIAEL